MARRFPVFTLVLAALCFAAMAILVRLASRVGYGTLELVVWRMGLGALGCVPIFLRTGERPRVGHVGLMLVRCLVGALSIVSYFWSLSLLPVGLATVFNYLGPLFVVLFAALFLGERPGRRMLAGLGIAFCGAALTAGSLAPGGFLGMAAGVLAALSQGVAVTMIRQLRRNYGATTIFFWFSVVSTAVCLPLALSQLHLPTSSDFVILLGIGLSSLLAQLLFTSALGHVPAATYSLVSPLTPMVAFLVGATFLHEKITPLIGAGAAIAVGGVVLGTFGQTREKEELVVSESV